MANSEKQLLGDLLLGNFGKLHKGDTVTIVPAPRTGDTISLLQTMVERHFGIDMVPICDDSHCEDCRSGVLTHEQCFCAGNDWPPKGVTLNPGLPANHQRGE